MLNSALGRFLYLNMNFSPKVLLKKGFSDKKNLSKEVHKHYLQPFSSKASRLPLLDLGKALVGSSDWYQLQWEQLDALSKKDWLILWGTRDAFITTDYLDKWIARLPHAEIKKFTSGHFVQEEKTSEAVAAIKDFMN
ncbi:MAG: alpha/beta hydrolase, partial [Bacteroidota bacterium]